MMGALDELVSRGLIDWSRAVVEGLARHICQGHLRDQLGWLPRLPWSVMLGVCWWSCGAARSGWALPPHLRPRPPRGPGSMCGSAAIARYGHDHRLCGCVTNCVTITTHHDGLP